MEQIAFFAGGCFWCTEAVFQRVVGVNSVVSGYMGGNIKNPAYREICTGRTGHAECVKITYDQALVTYDELLRIFFATHDPTTLNRQGSDVGTQYRSAIFYTSDIQKTTAMQVMEQLQTSVFKAPIVTTLLAEMPFYSAEEEHQNYYNQNSSQGYCSYVISPKVNTLKDSFKHLLKTT